MLHHVSLEVDPGEVEACVACWRLLGFEPVEPPAELGGHVTWLENTTRRRDENRTLGPVTGPSAATQIHLIHTEGATVPALGHAAVAVADFEATFAALEEAGHEPERHRELWGEPRAFLTMPGGHRVEFMAAAPPSGPS